MSKYDENSSENSKFRGYFLFILLFGFGFFGLDYLKSGSDDELPSNGITADDPSKPPTETAATSSQAFSAPELPEPPESRAQESEPERVQASSSVCREVTASSQAFLDQIGESIGVSSSEIEIIGGRHQYPSSICNLKIVTPMGVMECNSGPIYTDDGGLSYYTLGTDVGVNNSCAEIK